MSEERKIEPALMKTGELAERVGITAKRLREWQRKSLHRIPSPALREKTMVKRAVQNAEESRKGFHG